MKISNGLKGIFFGVIAGVFDVIPMIYQGLPIEASISAFSFWVIAGFIISTSNLRLPSQLKGMILASILLIPTGVLIACKDPLHLIPITIITIIIGAMLGYFID